MVQAKWWRWHAAWCSEVGMHRTRSYSTVLITGASAGLGEEFALQLAGRVETMILTARRLELLESLAKRLRDARPSLRVVVVAADLAKTEERLQLAVELEKNELVPDLLVNNAGLGDYGEFATAEWSRLEAMLRVNMVALTHLTHLLVPGMIREGGGAVLNVSSLASLLPIPDFAVYAATKAYVTSFSEALRIELKGRSVDVLAVCPGPVHTDFGFVARRGENEPGMPGREGFYVSKQQVVSDSLTALGRKRARVYPGRKIAIAALLLSLMPLCLIRAAMSNRPRRRA
jgi:short-subunit dehydrogenase